MSTPIMVGSLVGAYYIGDAPVDPTSVVLTIGGVVADPVYFYHPATGLAGPPYTKESGLAIIGVIPTSTPAGNCEMSLVCADNVGHADSKRWTIVVSVPGPT